MKYIDMHCDTIVEVYNQHTSLSNNHLHIDVNKLSKGQCLLQNFAIFTDRKVYDVTFTKAVIERFKKEIAENSDKIKQIFTYDDIINNDKNGYINAMLTLEDGDFIDNNLENLDKFYEDGVRMIGLTWNYKNAIASPNFEFTPDDDFASMYTINTKDGLSDFGIEYVRRCNELGIVVDCAHASDKTFYDLLEYSTKPFVASHSNARGVCGICRNLSDDMILKLAKKGGVMGMNFCSAFLQDGNEEFATIDMMVNNIKYIANLAGVDVIGIGSDMDGISNKLEIVDCSGMQRLYEALRKDFSEEDCEKIFYKNVLRVYKEVLSK